MSGVIKDREKQIEELDCFIKETQKRIEDVVSSLGWTYESISNDKQTIITCPFNKDHRIEEKSLERHLEKCQWKAEGYREDDLPLSEPCPSVDATSSIKFDEQLQDDVLHKAREKNPAMRTAAGVADRLIPRTSDRLMASFTSDERKSIYDYVVENTIKPDIGDDIADMNKMSQKDGNNTKTSLLELLAQERNLKRRRAKHRGVHTNKKSQVEILREVINQQMEMYEEYIADSNVKREPKSPSSSRTENKYHEPTRRSIKREFGHERDRKRNRSGSRDTERTKHRSKHNRDRSKDRNRHEEGRGRHRSREDKKSQSMKEDGFLSEDRKRHDKRDKHRDRSHRRDQSNDHHSRKRRN